ncbi:MAG: hypothetical protein V4614_15195 [Pseudomonadota bacterium]
MNTPTSASDAEIIAVASQYNRQLDRPLPVVMVPLNTIAPYQPDTAEVTYQPRGGVAVRRFKEVSPCSTPT